MGPWPPNPHFFSFPPSPPHTLGLQPLFWGTLHLASTGPCLLPPFQCPLGGYTDTSVSPLQKMLVFPTAWYTPLPEVPAAWLPQRKHHFR